LVPVVLLLLVEVELAQSEEILHSGHYSPRMEAAAVGQAQART
jgi:hypothetical protein